MKYQFIHDHKDSHRITVLCDALGIKRSSYYDWCRRKESATAKANRQLLDKIKTIHKASRENYGAYKTWRSLRRSGENCGLHRVERLRRKHGIEAKRNRLFQATKSGRNSNPAADNILNREFKVEKPDRVWASDITFINTQRGVLFLAVVIDLYSRRVVGWSMANKQDRYLVKDALLMAIKARRPVAGLIHHSDRGIQYTSRDYQAVLKAHDMIPSMSRKGNCHDNAVVESFFSHLKNELIYHQVLFDREHARSAIFDYIELFYNRQRIHRTLNYKTPVEYEMMKVA